VPEKQREEQELESFVVEEWMGKRDGERKKKEEDGDEDDGF
jgi:hypothetical protein